MSGTEEKKKTKSELGSCDLPDAEKLGLLARRRRLRLHFQRVDVGDGDDGGGHVPGEAHERADHYEDGHPEEVQVIACTFLESRRMKCIFPHREGGTPALKMTRWWRSDATKTKQRLTWRSR